MNFEFATATKIVFGPGSAAKVGRLAADLGHHALLTYGVSQERQADLSKLLSKAGLQVTSLQVLGEPSVEVVEQGIALARRAGCDLVIGLGGGSAIDVGKAIAAFLTNPGELYDYLEVIGRGQALRNPSAPFIAIPTTAGTGAEVTSNAVMSAAVPEAPERKIKVSLRSPFMLARLALVDPELTLDLPPEITASTGLDALTQLIEPYVSNRANPLTDALCVQGMLRAAHALRAAYHNGSDLQARQDMSLASLFSGLALANAKLGAVHGFAAPLGGRYPAPHGAVCARLLPVVMQVNLRALRERQPDSPALLRYHEIARILTGSHAASPEDGADWVQALVAELGVPGLSAYGLKRADFSELAASAARASSMQGNPIQLTEAELVEIMGQSLMRPYFAPASTR